MVQGVAAWMRFASLLKRIPHIHGFHIIHAWVLHIHAWVPHIHTRTYKTHISLEEINTIFPLSLNLNLHTATLAVTSRSSVMA